MLIPDNIHLPGSPSENISGDFYYYCISFNLKLNDMPPGIGGYSCDFCHVN